MIVLPFCKVGAVPCFPKPPKSSTVPLFVDSTLTLSCTITHLRALLMAIKLSVFSFGHMGFKELVGPQPPISELLATEWHLWSLGKKCEETHQCMQGTHLRIGLEKQDRCCVVHCHSTMLTGLSVPGSGSNWSPCKAPGDLSLGEETTKASK